MLVRGVELIVLFIILVKPGITTLADDTVCPVEDCFNSHPHDLDSTGGRYYNRNEAAPSPRQTRTNRKLCATLLAFSECLRNASRICLGNLLYHSTLRNSERRITSSNCILDANAPSREPDVALGLQHDEELEQDDQTIGDDDPRCQSMFTGSEATRSYCVMFGDPHLRTFAGVVETCRLQGTWPLFENEYLTVQITNGPVGTSGDATVITKLTILVKPYTVCAGERYLTYQAQSGDLPTSFDDGRAKVRSVEVISHSAPDEHVEIVLKYIDTTIIIRRVGQFYSVGVAMPGGLIVDSDKATGSATRGFIQLCTNGCPRTELVDLEGFFDVRRLRKQSRTVLASDLSVSGDTRGSQRGADGVAPMMREVAQKLCFEQDLSGFYLDACTFDLMNSGDVRFATAARDVIFDLERLVADVVDGTTIMVANEGVKEKSGSLIIFLVIYSASIGHFCAGG